jgi:hypothetical protein
MTQDLQFILTITLCFIAFVFWVSLKPKNASKNVPYNRILDTLDLMAEDIAYLKNNKKQKTSSKSKLKSDEIIDTLEWMLAHNIITPQEYTKLMGKCLQYM